jgi:hypothetical protein
LPADPAPASFSCILPEILQTPTLAAHVATLFKTGKVSRRGNDQSHSWFWNFVASVAPLREVPTFPG